MQFIARIGILGAVVALELGSPIAVRSASSGDAAFMTMAAQGGIAELQMAAVGIRKSRNPVVIDYVRLMRADHTKNNSQLNAIALKEGRTLPTAMDPDGQAMVTKLQSLSDADFNRGYLTSQVTAHTQMLALMQNEIAKGTDPQLKAFAKMTLPIVQQHLALAKKDLSMPSAMPNPM